MAFLDNSSVENIGINYLENLLLKTGIISSDINRKDKKASWDGSISVYSDVHFSKKTFIEEIPVQVKCRTVQKYSNKISIDVEDMRNYRTKKKILYFVIQLLNDEYKIFYKPFLLWDMFIARGFHFTTREYFS